MEIGVRGRRTRARDFGADGGTPSTAVKRRRKLDDSEEEEWSVSTPEIGFSVDFFSRDDDVQRPEIRADSRRFDGGDRCQDRSSSDRDPGAATVSCCSSYGSSEKGNDIIEIVDLEEVSTETTLHKEDEIGVHSNTQRSDTAADESPRRSISEKKKHMVSEADLEDFFSAADNERQKKLLEYTKKYNFDFSKEDPLEGRYEWVRLKK